MRKYFGFEGLSPDRFLNPVVTIGTFDGVHIGHQAVLRLVRERAGALSGESVVLTFETHPREVLFGLRPNPVTLLHQRLGLIAAEGVDACIVLRFNKELAGMSAADFLEGLVKATAMREIVQGPDSRFGRDREGGAALLRQKAGQYGFAVTSAPKVTFENETVSSSRLRELIASGDLGRTSAMLGRPYSLFGNVVRGRGRGKDLGFPTANLDMQGQLLPPTGVYATLFLHGGSRLPSVTSIGKRPTYGESLPVEVETHVLDFDGELYGADAELVIVEKIRDQLRFPSEEALASAIKADIVKARAMLGRTQS